MDIENYVKKCIHESKTEKETIEKLSTIIRFYKNINQTQSTKLSQAVYEEVQITEQLEKNQILTYPKTNIHMGEFGVGSRGQGDFYVHSKIAEIIKNTKTSSIVNPTAQDDGGVVKIDKNTQYVTTAIDGIHSRLGDYPFLAGFHTARATLRDVCVMGAKPVALISDIHLADDGDIAKILDYTAGICAVSELTNVPLVSGSTLRVGGDMVLGDRLVGAVGAVGTSPKKPTARSESTNGDIILMTEGSGGGTITTTAIYNNMPQVIMETLNVQFIKASNLLNPINEIHALTDITNGGINGDANEINKTTGLGIHLYEEKIIELINPKVYEMLKTLNIDPLGVSIDSLMIITPKNTADKIIKTLEKENIKSGIIGYVNNTGKTTIQKSTGEIQELVPKFREAAYTPVKKVVDEIKTINFEEGKQEIDKVTREVISKKEDIVRWIQNKHE
ncbi:AIR synthase-related protein [Methanosphaera sp. ISO3-F5]|uniref:AIR synthase-related protein n=1 Tax=Methanosphaera sp. ISO3-F5 TaxID=1452353 RepID=UPI002B26086A|nr:AIR synthase-related protein [Methanosphaera sp. ISO3-F5]WQH64826.1 AIR synthase-related protein [Methanosphaera sp. ISO3-F5]